MGSLLPAIAAVVATIVGTMEIEKNISAWWRRRKHKKEAEKLLRQKEAIIQQVPKEEGQK